MKLSIAFLTGRKQPHLDWLISTLIVQTKPDDEIEVIVIDALEHRRAPEDAIISGFGRDEPAVLGRSPAISIRVVPVCPNVWQGRHRVTSIDYWATAASRNTFLGVATHDYIVMLDDCSRPGAMWLDTVRRGERERASVLAGSFEKLEGPARTPSKVVDHRRVQFPEGKPDCGGAWLYGCTFCLPLEWALEVNGFEEGCDSIAGEDYMFGLMVGNNGHRIDFEPTLHVVQERDPGDESCLPMFPKLVKEGKDQAALARFGSRTRTVFTPDLRAIRAELGGRGRPWPIPDPAGDHRDWFDGQWLRDMR